MGNGVCLWLEVGGATEERHRTEAERGFLCPDKKARDVLFGDADAKRRMVKSIMMAKLLSRQQLLFKMTLVVVVGETFCLDRMIRLRLQRSALQTTQTTLLGTR